MKNALVLTRFDLRRDPRPLRMIECLRQHYRVWAVGCEDFQGDDVTYVRYEKPGRRTLPVKLVHMFGRLFRRYEFMIRDEGTNALERELSSIKYDLIVCHDLIFLPLACRIAGNAKVIFDAREYYPKHYEENRAWRFHAGALNDYLCRKYMPLADVCFTVGDGISMEYKKNYGVQPMVIESWPRYHQLEPSDVDMRPVRLIHHGATAVNRKIESMMYMMDDLGNGYHLDIMLLNTAPAYRDFLQREADKRSNVRLLESIPFDDIIPFINRYDVGVFLVPPVNFNLANCLPNKLFEYIQARLAVLVGPSPEMRRVVEKYGVGMVAEEYSPRALADSLKKMSAAQLVHYKRQAHLAAEQLTAQRNCARILRIVDGL